MFGEQYKPVTPPVCFFYIFTCFQELYNMSSERITYQDIDSYCRVNRLVFSHYELQLIKKMISWAENEKRQLEKEEEKGVDQGQI